MPAFGKNSLQTYNRADGRLGLPSRGGGLSEQLLDAIGVATSEVHEIAEAGNGANFGVHEGRVLGCGFLELDEGLREIVFEILEVGRIVEAVDVPIFVQSSDGEGPAGNNCRARLLNAASADALAYKCRSRGRQSRHYLVRIRWARTSEAPRG
jgi:hypothetical protein